MIVQPLEELDHVGIAPHPRRKPPKVGERFNGKNVVTGSVQVAVDAVGIGPISLDRDGRKAFLLDKPLRDLGALVVKLVRAVGCFAEQHEACVADPIHEWVVVLGDPC